MSGKIKEKTSEAEDRIFDSYLFVNYANKGKLEKINQVFIEYRKTVKDISNYLRNIFFQASKLSHRKKINIKHIPSCLSERYKYVYLWQTYDILSGYIVGIQRKFT
jgi:putative transposase